MADIFLKIDGDQYQGESQDSSHPNEIVVQSWSWGEANAGTMGSGTGGGGGSKVSFSDFNFMMNTCKASPNLFSACATGTHIDTATMTIRKSGGTQVEFLIIKFTDILISSYQCSQSMGGDDLPAEAISFNFAAIDISYSPQGEDGTLAAAIEANYNVQTQASA